MAHPLHHAESSARKFGGKPSDYQALHDFFDVSKEHLALFVHRAHRHHALGVFELERQFGRTLTNSAGRVIPTRWIGEQHVREDCQGRIPSLADWLVRIRPEPWMANGRIDNDSPGIVGDPRVAWRTEVADGRTILGLRDWMAAYASGPEPAAPEASCGGRSNSSPGEGV